MAFLRSCYFIVARMFRWAGTGAAMGALCGMLTGVYVAVVLSGVVFAAFLDGYFFSSMISWSVRQSFITCFIGLWLLAIAIGLFLGFVIGAMICAVISLVEWRHKLPSWTNEHKMKLLRLTAISSFVGSVSCMTSIPLLMLLIARDFLMMMSSFDLIVGSFVIGALGGFAVGLFRGARNIIRENVGHESSTR